MHNCKEYSCKLKPLSIQRENRARKERVAAEKRSRKNRQRRWKEGHAVEKGKKKKKKNSGKVVADTRARNV